MIKEQFTNGINDDEMMSEVIKELTKIKITNKITSDQVLHWAKEEKHKE